MLTLMLATVLAAAPAPNAMPCAGCSPQAMADCPMGSSAMGRTDAPQAEHRIQDHADRH
jgi:hypothetical protein